MKNNKNTGKENKKNVASSAATNDGDDQEENLEELQKQVGAATEGDSVTEDIHKFKSITKQLGDKLSGAVKPHHEKVKGAVKEQTTKVSMKVSQKSASAGLPKWLPMAGGIVILLLALTFVGKRFVENGGSSVEATPTPTEIPKQRPTPTIEGPIFPYEASVYATDDVILKIEETNNILRNEMFTVSLSESVLIPPSLDYNVDFGN